MKIQFYGPPNEKKAAERIAEKLGGSELARVAAMATVSMISHGYCEYTESEAFETVKDLICEYCGSISKAAFLSFGQPRIACLTIDRNEAFLKMSSGSNFFDGRFRVVNAFRASFMDKFGFGSSSFHRFAISM